MKHIKNIAIAFCFLLASNVASAQTYTADVSVTRQEQTNWCWVANTKCILNYYGYKSQKQCDIAEYARTLKTATFGTTSCCSSPSGKCNNPNEIKYNYGISGMLTHFGSIANIPTDAPVPLAQIKTELEAKRPFVIGIFWSQGGGHVVVGCGYNTTSSGLTFMDPWQSNGMTTCKYTGGKTVVTRTGTGSWGESLILTTPVIATGIAEHGNTKELRVFPNPSQGELTINSENHLKSINVFNTTGQLIDKYVVEGQKSYSFKISIAGFYTVQIITDTDIVNRKVIVNNN
ncbi:MAG: T9SS type A sorting domain-containing protein [Bacteroidia bacterium]